MKKKKKIKQAVKRGVKEYIDVFRSLRKERSIRK